MRKFLFSLILFFLLFTNAIAQIAAQGDTLRILAIGNSFSVNAVEQNLHELAAADGNVAIIGNMYIGGCSLERHFNNLKSDAPAYSYRKIGEDGIKITKGNYTLRQALSDEKWDIITLQQQSGLSGKLESYEPYFGKLVKFIKKEGPAGAKIMFFQTWAYAKNAAHSQYSLYNCNQDEMYRAIVDASREISEKYGIPVIPGGTAIQNIRQTFVGENVTADGYHLNRNIGEYTVASAWYEAIFGKNVIENPYKGGCHEAEDILMSARTAAHCAVENPYEVTDLKIKTPSDNCNEACVPEFDLPDPLVFDDGTPVESAQQWYAKRRPELFSLIEREEYGKAPGRPADMHFKILHEKRKSNFILREVAIYLTAEDKQPITLLLVLPTNTAGPVPVFLGVNFYGNHAVMDDESILLPDESRYKIFQLRPRGSNSEAWPVDMILEKGYGLATFYRGDVDPDFDDGFVNGVHGMMSQKGRYPFPDEWGAIAAWSWSLSRALDYLETEPLVDASKVAVIGHSRLGKAALWAAAADTRFAMAVSNNSGCGGAALSKRKFGETVDIINKHFPHWFCDNFRKYSGNEEALPFDQHEVLALIAPRPLYIASASMDGHADPKGEFLSAKYASRVYEFLGYEGLGAEEMPPMLAPVNTGRVAYHLRAGRHRITSYDWSQYLLFADKFLK